MDNNHYGGLVHAGRHKEGLMYFSEMSRFKGLPVGTKPTDFALASLLEQGRQVHALSLHLGLEQNPTIRSALINMYSKCGSIVEASKVFEETERADIIVAFTAMINGYAEHGKSKEAIDLFEKSLKVGFRPDTVSFISVLTACSHSGQLDLGFHYFNLMQDDKYNISPAKEHYGCMVDLLCRAGRLSEAEKMIHEMPCKKDDVVSMDHKHFSEHERGRRAAEKILEVEPTSSTALVTLANINSKYREVERGCNCEEEYEIERGDQRAWMVFNIYSILELLVSVAVAHRYDCAIKKGFESIQICDP